MKKTRGMSEQMKPALQFAEENGFTVALTSGQHLEFKGHNQTVIASANPRNHYGAKQAISNMRKAIRMAAEKTSAV